MSQQKPPSAPDSPQGDPWHAFGYIVSGVLVYGVIGALVDHWLGTTFIVAIGILLGAGFGIYMTWARFNKPGGAQPPDEKRDK
jgi:F0F1-type ATP synthase assembly protein I